MEAARGFRGLQHVPPARATRRICPAAVEEDGASLNDVPEALKDSAICLAAVEEHGMALEYVPEAERTRDLCLAAVLQTAPRALFRASYGPAGAKTPWPGLGCAAAVGLTAWGCAASSFALEGLTGTILPLGNAAAAALLLAGAALGKRKSPPSP